MKKFLILAFLPISHLGASATSSRQPRVLTKDWGPRFDKLSQLYGQASSDRSNLKNLRDKHIQLFSEEAAKPNPDYLGLTPGITTDMINYINTIIDETVHKMPPPPTRFEIFTLGSMARDESGFFTDLEIGILVAEKTPEAKKYFETFAQLLSDRFFLLGEHPDVGGKGLRIDEADNAPLHLKWFARFASAQQVDDLLSEALLKRKFDKIPLEGSRLFIATPQEFAEYLNPLALDDKTLREAKDLYRERIEALFEQAWQEKVATLDLSQMSDAQRSSARAETRKLVRERFDGVLRPLSRKEYNTAKSLQTLVRNIRHLYGDESLFNEYIQAREVYLQGPPKKPNPHYNLTRRQEIVYTKDLDELSRPLSDSSSPLHGTLGKSVDLKRQLYRFPEQVLTNRGFWYSLPVQNTSSILHELVSRGLFNAAFAEKLRNTLNFITGLRLKEQAILRKQGFAIPATPEEWQDNKDELEESIKSLTNLKNSYLEFKLPQEDIDKVQNKISTAESQLRSLEKMKPLEIDSILTTEEIAELNSTHLPVLNELYQRNIAFLKGDPAAFTRAEAITESTISEDAPSYENGNNDKAYRLAKLKEFTRDLFPRRSGAASSSQNNGGTSQNITSTSQSDSLSKDLTRLAALRELAKRIFSNKSM